tara:strand:+ start:516 stop:959 length:444 start_codon:yes stop_codon:yes gene_type:complete
MIVGEAPGATEHDGGEPFIGRSGKLLDTFLGECLIRRNRCVITNAVKCFPSMNGKAIPPIKKQTNRCEEWLKIDINNFKPGTIFTFGKVAECSIRNIWKPSEYRLMSFYHPAYWLRRGGQKSDEYINDLVQFKSTMMYYRLERGWPT